MGFEGSLECCGFLRGQRSCYRFVFAAFFFFFIALFFLFCFVAEEEEWAGRRV